MKTAEKDSPDGTAPDAPMSPPAKRHPTDLDQAAVTTLDLPRKKWGEQSIQATQELGRFMTTRMTGQMLLVETLRTMEMVEAAMRVAQQIAENADNDEVKTEDRLCAINAIANAAKAHKELSGQLLELAEKAAEKQQTEKKRNLPPTVALQVNVAGVPPSPSPATPASSGSLPQRNLPPV